MSRKFELRKDPYDSGFDLYKRMKLEINSGVTVLVGCNGIGKTTFIHQIVDELNKLKIPYIEYDILHEGGDNAISKAGYYGDFIFMTTAMQSSEGENIWMNISKFASELGNFVKIGKVKEKNPFMEVFNL